MNNLQKRGIRFSINRNPDYTLSDIRFLIKNSYITKTYRHDLKQDLLDSDLPWQERIKWLNRVINWKGKKRDNFDYLCIRYNSIDRAEAHYRRKSESVMGKANPAYQHNGKFSPLSDKFIHADIADKKKIKEKIRQSNKNNGNNDCTMAYWLKQTDGDIEAAKRLLSKRQSTFSLVKCKEKHGDEKGHKIWLERQEKWQKTLNEKPAEEIARINKAKATKINYNTLWGVALDTMGIFYVLEVTGYNELFYKLGITSKTVNQRYNTEQTIGKYSYKIIYFIKDTMVNCFKLEQQTLRENVKHAYTPTFKFEGYSECLTHNPINLIPT